MTPIQHLLELQRVNLEKSAALMASLDANEYPAPTQIGQAAQVELLGKFWSQINAVIQELQA